MSTVTDKSTPNLQSETPEPLILSHPADGIVSDAELGALYTPEETTFRVWAPTASELTLKLYQGPVTSIVRNETLKRSPVEPWDGTWETTITGDLIQTYYTFTANGDDPRFDPSRELIDPYARAVTRYDGRAIVVDDHTPIADRPDFARSESIIYELNVRDFTIDPDSGVQRRGKYLGLAEPGTLFNGRSDISTGLDHLSDLGVNVIQLMPVTEFHHEAAEDEYGWGYDVVHFNSPAGWYATERLDGRRIHELKLLIDTLHKRGMRVTLDFVFNHTYEHIGDKVYSFEGLVPGYYYRLKQDGTYWNGSGTGNEFRSEAPMARRFILDTVKYWVDEYKVDGFRFDLLGLIDLETLEMISRELNATDPNILMYGEPWAGGTTAVEVINKGQQRNRGWAVFNDHFRDAIKGRVFDARSTGFIQSGNETLGVKIGIRGSIDDFSESPLESINYVESHDNHTLRDRLMISTANQPKAIEAERRAMAKLAGAIVLTAQGIPMIHSGQEFLRTKGGDDNSYDRPDSVNMIRWCDKIINSDVFEHYKALIRIRKEHPVFHLETADQVNEAITFLDSGLGLPVPDGCIAFQIEDVNGTDSWSRALVIFNSRPVEVSLEIPEGNWQSCLSLNQAVSKSSVTVLPRSAAILGEPKPPVAGISQKDSGDKQ
jgi:pullulanase